MRTQLLVSRAALGLSLGLSLGASLVGASGCKWTEFDDLQEDTWVTSTGKPDNDAANWGVAIARVTQGGDLARLAVIGASEAVYNDVTIDRKGETKVTSELEIGATFVLGNLAVEPLLLSSPDSNEAALAAVLADGRATVIRARDGVLTNIFVVGTNAPPVAATYMIPPATDGDPVGAQVLVAQGSTVHPSFFFRTMQPNPPLKCQLRDDSMQEIQIRSMGAFRPVGAAYDDLLVLSQSGKLLIYDGDVFNGCDPARTPRFGMTLDLGFTDAVSGSQILAFEDLDQAGAVSAQYALVQAHGDGGRSHLGLYRIDGTEITQIGLPQTLPGLRTAAVFRHQEGDQRYVLASYPTESIDGVTGGVVRAFELDTEDTGAGIGQNVAHELHDAQPEANQAFGRGLAVLPYNGKNIIAVAADNEVFLYFRTLFYGETRQDR